MTTGSMTHAFFKLADALLPYVLEAGAVTLRHFGTTADAAIKADGSPVTGADHASEAILLAGLREIAADIPVVAEEACAAAGPTPPGENFFLVDPLDGTREFAAGRKEYTINIGLIENGVPMFGLIYAPALSKLYVTVASDHAVSAIVETGSSKRLTALDLNRLAARTPPSAGGITLVASGSHGSADLESWLAHVPVAARTNIGSSLKFCLVAEGAADIYPRFGPTKEWDTAAGHAILAAAGGSVTTTEGRALIYGKTDAYYLNPSFIAWGCAADADIARLCRMPRCR